MSKLTLKCIITIGSKIRGTQVSSVYSIHPYALKVSRLMEEMQKKKSKSVEWGHRASLYSLSVNIQDCGLGQCSGSLLCYYTNESVPTTQS